MHKRTHAPITSPPRVEKSDHQYLNGQHLACEMWTGMYAILTKSGLSFIYKMIWEIISMPRADSGYYHNFGVNSWIFKNDESETKAKTDSRYWVCPLLAGRPLLACTEHAQSPLLAHHVSACGRIHCLKTISISISRQYIVQFFIPWFEFLSHREIVWCESLYLILLANMVQIPAGTLRYTQFAKHLM